MGKSSLLLFIIIAFTVVNGQDADSLKIWNDQSRLLHEQRRLLEASLLYEKIVKR